MSFTLWSRGSLLGELELTTRPREGTLIGRFWPTDAGRSVLPLFLSADCVDGDRPDAGASRHHR